MGAGSESRQTPALQLIELADLLQQQKRSGVDVRRQFGDFFAEAGGDLVSFDIGLVDMGGCGGGSTLEGHPVHAKLGQRDLHNFLRD